MNDLRLLSLPDGNENTALTRADGKIILFQLHLIGQQLEKVVAKSDAEEKRVDGLEDWKRDVDKERKLVKGVIFKAATPGALATLIAYMTGFIQLPHGGK
jgi:hypothetical protein